MGAGRFAIKERDRGQKELFKRVRELSGNAKVAVGIRGESALAKKQSGIDEGTQVDAPTLVDIATWQEYGTDDGNIPERSFIRATVEENRSRYISILETLAKQILDPVKPIKVDKALAILGEYVKADIQKRIRKGIDPELSEFTIKLRLKKGNTSQTPLIVTGQLIGGISYEVRLANKKTKGAKKK